MLNYDTFQCTPEMKMKLIVIAMLPRSKSSRFSLFVGKCFTKYKIYSYVELKNKKDKSVFQSTIKDAIMAICLKWRHSSLCFNY